MTLYEAKKEARVKLLGIHGSWSMRQRLRELGLHVGDAVLVLHRGPFGGAMAIRCRGTLIAIGRHLANSIQVETTK